jgi:hypothetical protein
MWGWLAGIWKKAYILSEAIALYFTVFVLVAQLFAKVPALKGIGSDSIGRTVQTFRWFVLLLFVVLGVVATNRSGS